MNHRSILLSWAGFAATEMIICPLHGVSKLLLWPLASLCPIVAQGCRYSHDLLVSGAYALLTWHRTPPVPSLAYFQTQAQAVQAVHTWGTTLAVGLLLAPLVQVWAQRRWSHP